MVDMLKFQVCIILGVSSVVIGVKWSSPISTFQAMLKYENSLLDRLYNQVTEAEQVLEDLRIKVEQVRQEAKDIHENFDRYFGHPIRQLQMLNRYKYEWTELENMSKQPLFISKKLYGNVTRAMKVFPKHTDRVAARHALLRLQHTYKLETRDLANGNVRGKLSTGPLTAHDCAKIAEAAHIAGREQQCREWNVESFARLYHVGVNDYTKIPRRFVDCSTKPDEPLIKDGTSKRYRELCNNEVEQKQKMCYLWTRNKHPWLILQPVKTEILYFNPRIVRFYDIARDLEIKSVINVSKSILQWGYTGTENVTDVSINITSPRVGHVAWLIENETLEISNGVEDGEIAKRLSERVRTIVGLDGTRSDAFQVAHYGVGGQFLFHFDNFPKGSEGERYDGNRIASLLLYLSDIPEGGNTVFKYPKISSKPIKGSAILWYNLLPDGEANKWGMHAGCPTLIGSKWIAVKWFHEIDKGMSRNPKYFDNWKGDR